MRTPRCLSATPSAFQNDTTASTRPETRLGTAEKPIVTLSTRSKSPPSSSTTARSTASSDGSPVTPTRRPSRSRGRRTSSARAITAASGRWTSAPTPTTSLPASRASPRSWMSTTDMSTRPAASSFSESVLAAGTRILQALGRVDARVHGVRLEVERDRARPGAGRESSPPQPGEAAPVAAIARRNRRTAANSTGGTMNSPEVIEVQDRGPAAYIAEFVGTLLLVFFITAVVSLYVTAPSAANPAPVHRLLGDRPGARVPALRPDPDARDHLGRALQPRRHGRDDRAAPDQAARRARSTSSPSSPARWPAPC